MQNANGRTVANPDRTAAGSSHDGDGSQHRRGALRAPEVAVITDPAIAAIGGRAKELGRRWFLRHPSRAYRLRPSLRYEFPGTSYPASAEPLTLAKPITLGRRRRAPSYARRRLYGWEACVADLWERLGSDGIQRVALDMAAIMVRGRE